MECNDRYVKNQITLLMWAVGNVIDDNTNIELITMNEIWDWLNDILREGWQ